MPSLTHKNLPLAMFLETSDGERIMVQVDQHGETVFSDLYKLIMEKAGEKEKRGQCLC
jgi:hypothetical protein